MLIVLTAVFGVVLSASAVTTSGKADFGVKQTIVFSDDSQVEIYYVKDTDGYKVCSETNLATYTFDRLLTVKKTSMELCRNYKGEVQLKAASLSEVRSYANRLYRQLNTWLNNYQQRTGKSLDDIFGSL